MKAQLLVHAITHQIIGTATGRGATHDFTLFKQSSGVPPESRTNLTRDEGSPPAVGWKARPTL
ncbi:hypothetical protein [Deinococcus fonticola]|uniref:hypothetical protein n=1 Tax=Deinococcus fonticola TaxID=2528713 RepID=UPI003B837D6B